jgi:phosphoribosyl-AMP cyclohydrolase / phosphoribosyl-ATP pyrophosphohydrolase
MSADYITGLDWAKGDGLLPAVIQDVSGGVVLMTGYVNPEALAAMEQRREVVLWSRSRQRLWLKGETSGNRIAVERILIDCDRDAILVLGRPRGPVCHTGQTSCFPGAVPEAAPLAFLATLERVIASRLERPVPGSYTAGLAASGVRRLAQKVGEEALEVALAALTSEEDLLAESADLLFHLLVLLRARNVGLTEVAGILESRHEAREAALPG